MCGSMAYIQFAAAEIRRGIKKRKKKEQTTAWKYIWSALFHRATINKHLAMPDRVRDSHEIWDMTRHNNSRQYIQVSRLSQDRVMKNHVSRQDTCLETSSLPTKLKVGYGRAHTTGSRSHINNFIRYVNGWLCGSSGFSCASRWISEWVLKWFFDNFVLVFFLFTTLPRGFRGCNIIAGVAWHRQLSVQVPPTFMEQSLL